MNLLGTQTEIKEKTHLLDVYPSIMQSLKIVMFCYQKRRISMCAAKVLPNTV